MNQFICSARAPLYLHLFHTIPLLLFEEFKHQARSKHQHSQSSSDTKIEMTPRRVAPYVHQGGHLGDESLTSAIVIMYVILSEP